MAVRGREKPADWSWAATERLFRWIWCRNYTPANWGGAQRRWMCGYSEQQLWKAAGCPVSGWAAALDDSQQSRWRRGSGCNTSIATFRLGIFTIMQCSYGMFWGKWFFSEKMHDDCVYGDQLKIEGRNQKTYTWTVGDSLLCWCVYLAYLVVELESDRKEHRYKVAWFAECMFTLFSISRVYWSEFDLQHTCLSRQYAIMCSDFQSLHHNEYVLCAAGVSLHT